jgi:putative membrane protein
MTKSKLSRIHATMAIVLGLAGASACSKGEDTTSTAPAASQGAEATPPESTNTPTDAQIVQIVATVDTGEIEQAQIATTKATSPLVREFATEMIDEHTKSKQEGTQLAASASITPTGSATANKLKQDGSQVRDSLTNADATSFDQTYIKAQVKQHQEVLDMLKAQLIPAATNAQLQQQLAAAQTMVEHHLMKAKQIDQSLSAAH